MTEKTPTMDNSEEKSTNSESQNRSDYYGEIPEELLSPEKQEVMQKELVNEFKKLGEKEDILQIARQVLKPKPILEVEVLEEGVLHIIYGEGGDGLGNEDIVVKRNESDNLAVTSFYSGFASKSDYPSYGEFLENPVSLTDNRNRKGGKLGSLDYHDNKDYKQ